MSTRSHIASVSPRPQHPWLIAHRGASHEYPENTMLAFEQALSHPIDGIEIDLQLSRDEQVLVYHDRTLAKAGKRNRRVRHLLADQLRTLRLHGEALPFFEEVVTPLAQRCRLLLEIKRREPSGQRDRLERLMALVVESVLARQLAERVFLLCFDEALLRWAQSHYPRLRYVLNQDRPRILEDDGFLFAYSVNVRRLNPLFGAQVHARHKWLMTYTVNGPRQLARARAAQADVIMSDKPNWLVDQCSAHGPNRNLADPSSDIFKTGIGHV